MTRTVAVRHVLLDRGIRYKTRIGDSRVILWHEIIDIDHSRWSDMLELRLRDGSKASISTKIIGFPHLARAVLENAPSHAELGERTHVLLSESLDSMSPA